MRVGRVGRGRGACVHEFIFKRWVSIHLISLLSLIKNQMVLNNAGTHARRHARTHAHTHKSTIATTTAHTEKQRNRKTTTTAATTKTHQTVT